MANYFWSTITAQEALGFTAADRLFFDTAGATALNVTIGWGAAVTTLTLGDKTLTFVTDEIDGEDDGQIVFLDGSNLLIDGRADDGLMTFGVAGGQALGLGDVDGAGNDLIDGTAAEASVFANGNRGDDQIGGGAGADTLFGGQGDDQVLGGDGDDSLNGNIGIDLVSGEAGNDSIFGGQDDDGLDGGEGDDSLSGDLGDDIVGGGEGDDYLAGGQGDDQLDGGLGADTAFGGDGDDLIVGGPDPDEDEGDDSLSGNAGEDTLVGGDGDDAIFGGRDDDQLVGGAGDDVLSGDLDDDIIEGGEGADEMTGGEDDDTFVFAAGDTPDDGGEFDEDAIDVITDFAGDDLIDLGGFVVTLDSDEADDFEGAVEAAADGFTGGASVMAVEADDGVYLFVDFDSSATVNTGDVVVFLAGVAADDITADSFA